MSKLNLRIVIGGAVVIVLLLLLGVWLRQPERRINSALSKLGGAENQAFKAVLDLENPTTTQQALGEAGKVHLELNGVYNRAKTDTPASIQSDVLLGIESESVQLQLTGETRFIDSKVYFLLTKVPPVFRALVPLKGMWVEIPRGAAKTDDVPAASTDEALVRKVTSKGKENVAGMRTTRYEALATQAAVVRMMNSIATILGTQLTATQIKELKQGVGQVETVPVTVWMTPFGHNVKQLAGTLTIPGGNSVQFTFTFLDQNKKTEMKVPDGAKPLNEALKAS